MSLADAIVWMEVPDAREIMGGLPALSYYLDGCFDYYRAGVRTFVLSSSPQWMGYDPPGDAKAYGDLHTKVYSFMPRDCRLWPGIRPLPSHLSSMWDVEGWKAIGEWLRTLTPTVVLDMEVIFQSGRFDEFNPMHWYYSLMALPKDVVIWWNFPAILPSDDKSPNRETETMLLCRFIEWLRPDDELMDSSVAWASGSDVLQEAWSQRREWMMQLGSERILDRMLVAPNAAPFAKGDAQYFPVDEALTHIQELDAPQVIWTDAERWVAVAAEMREAVTG